MKCLYVLTLLALATTIIYGQSVAECPGAAVLIDPDNGSAYGAQTSVCPQDTATFGVSFSDVRVQQDTVLSYTWFVNDQPVPGLAGDRLDTLFTTAADYQVRVVAYVVDTTTLGGTAAPDTLCVAADTVITTVIAARIPDLAALGIPGAVCRNAGQVVFPVPNDQNGVPVPGRYQFRGGVNFDGPDGQPASFDPATSTQGSVEVSFVPAPSVACQISDTVIVEILPPPEVGARNTLQPRFCEGDLGVIQLDEYFDGDQTGGQWLLAGQPVAAAVDVSLLAAGSYDYVFQKTENGCTATSAAVTVTVSAIPAILAASTSGPSTCAGSDGSILLDLNTQNEDYRVQYTNLTTGATDGGVQRDATQDQILLNALGAGRYVLAITSSIPAQCASTFPDTVEVSDPGAPAVVVNAGANVVCLGEQVTISATSGLDNYVWSLDGGTASNGTGGSDLGLVDWATPGVKTITVTGTDSGCSSTATVNITVNDVPNAGTPTGGSPEYCEGETEMVDLSDFLVGEDAGGVWFRNGSPQPPLINIGDVSPGTYSFIYRVSANGCTVDSDPVTITVRGLPEILSAAAVNSNACGTATGRLSGTVSTQGLPYEITYVSSANPGVVVVGASGNSNTSNFQIPNLPAGTYELTITSLNSTGCARAFSQGLTIEDPSAPAVSILVDDVAICADETTRIRASVSSYDSYSWELDGGVPANNITGADLGQVSWSGAGAGAKSITLTAVNDNCTSAQQITMVDVAALPTVSIDAPEGLVYDCTAREAGGLELASMTSPNVRYNWAGPRTGGTVGAGPTFNVTRAGEFTLTVTTDDALGCEATSGPLTVTEDLVEPDVEVSSLNNRSVLTCAQPVITLLANLDDQLPGVTYEYSWTGGNDTDGATNPVDEAGLYRVEVTNTDNGCRANSPAFSIGADQNNPTVSGITGLTGTDVVALNCNNPAATLQATVNNGTNFTYRWIGPGVLSTAATLTVNAANLAGAYSVNVTNPVNDCATDVDFTLSSDFRAPNATLSDNGPAGDFAVCEGSPLELTGSVSNATPGDNPVYNWSIAGLGVNGNATFIDVPGSITRGNPGAYPADFSATFTSNGCSATTRRMVTVRENPTVETLDFMATAGVAIPANSVCQAGTARIEAEVSGGAGGYQYQWTADGASIGSTRIIPVNTTNFDNRVVYSVAVTDNLGCTATSSQDVAIYARPDVDVTNDEDSGRLEDNAEVCQGDAISLRARILNPGPTAGPYTYDWSGGGVDASFAPSTNAPGGQTYTVTVTDARGCQNTQEQAVTVRSRPAFTVATTDMDGNGEICSGEAFTLMASDPSLAYSWNDNTNLGDEARVDFSNGITTARTARLFNYTAVGTTVPFGCSNSAEADVIVNPNPEVAIVEDDIIYREGFGGQFEAEVLFGDNLNYSWEIRRPDNSLFEQYSSPETPVFTFDAIGTWTIALTAADNLGCTQTTNPPLRREVSDGNDCVARFSLTTPANNLFCAGATYRITDVSSNGSSASQQINSITYTFERTGGDNEVIVDGVRFPDGVVTRAATATEGNLGSVVFANPGEWTITMFVTNTDVDQGCNSSTQQRITVREIPSLLVFDFIDPAVCEDGQVELNVRADVAQDDYRLTTVIRGTTFGPNFPFTGSTSVPLQGASIIQSGTILDATVLENTTTGCSASLTSVSTSSITVNANPDIGLVSPDCTSDNTSYTVSFGVATQGNVAYSVGNRSFAGGEPFTSELITLPGDFDFTVVDANGCSEEVAGRAPVCDCETQIGSWPVTTEVCQGDPVRFGLPNGYRPDDDELVEYQLIRQDGDIRTVLARSGAIEPQMANLPAIGDRYSPTATYRLVITSANPDGGSLSTTDRCAVSDSLEIRVLVTPQVSVTNNEDLEVCFGEQLTVNHTIVLPADAESARLTYSINEFDDQGTITRSFENPVVVLRSGEFTAYAVDVLNRETTVRLARVETRYASGATCLVSVSEILSTRARINPVPTIEGGVATPCESDATFYRVQFTAVTQGGERPIVTGRPGSFDGDLWTSQPIPVEETYDITVTDANGCSISVPVETVTCECETAIGGADWNGGRLSFCRTSDIVIDDRPTGFNADDNDVIVFELFAEDADGQQILIDETRLLAPDAVAGFGSIESYNAFNPTFQYFIRASLGNPNNGGPAVNEGNCSESITFQVFISNSPEPRLQVLDPVRNIYTSSQSISFPQGTRDVQFRVVGGLNQANRYFWNVDDSGGEYFDNPFANASYLSVDLTAGPGRYSVSITEKEGIDTSCNGRATFEYTISEQQAGPPRDVYLVTTGGENVLIVDGADGCSYQWGFTRRNDPQRTEPDTVQGAIFQAYEVDGFAPDERLYWVDVTCGDRTTRHYYNREPTRVNEPRPLERPVTSVSGRDGRAASMLIIPNPVYEEFIVRLEAFPAGACTLQLYDGLGRAVQQRTVLVSDPAPLPITWHLPPGLSGGIYFLRATGLNGRSLTRRLIIQR